MNRTVAFILTAAAITIVYYTPFFYNFFVYDDFKMIENIFSGIPAILLGYNTVRIISNLSFLPLYFISGINPVGYNVFNISLHFLNSILLFIVMNRLSKNAVFSFLVGVVFVASAVGCDAIFWKISNATLLSVTFSLITLNLYLKWREEENIVYYNLSIITFSLAMFSKENAAALPLLIILIEILFDDKEFKKEVTLLKQVLPYMLIVLAYIVIGQILIRVFDIDLESMTRFFQVKPFYSLIGGFTVFFLRPDGYLDLWNPAIYITAVLIQLSFFFVKKRKLLWLGYGWIFISFIPSSFISLGRFDAPYMVNSISRYLYMSSIGSSIIFAAILLSFKERFPKNISAIASTLFFIIFISINYNRVHDRGNQWWGQGMLMERFLYSLKEVQPIFPENSYIHVINGPARKAYIQQSLRAFYGNPKIYWVDDPNNVTLKKEDSRFVIFHNWSSVKPVKIFRLK